MVIFIPFRQLAKFYHFLFALLLLFFTENSFAQQGGINRIYTDYKGFWSSSSVSNAVKPENDHNLLGFSWNGATYSTGVNDARLTANSVTFIPTVFQAFPVRNVTLTGSNCKIGLGQLRDGVNNGMPATPPFSMPPKISDFLTDGIQGLNIGTGVANVPASTPLIFDFGSIIDPTKINDGKPDILVSQIASPDAVLDQVYFTDVNGNRIGNIISIDQTQVTAVGTWTADFYELNGTLAPGFTNTDRQIRVWAADVSVFGITTANYTAVTSLRYELKGSSDPAFLAYNTSIIQVLSANDDAASTAIGTAVAIDVLSNDVPVSFIDASSVTVTTSPQHGSFTVTSTGVVNYTPNPGYYGTDSFVYRVYNNARDQFDDALVTINIGGPVATPVFDPGLMASRCAGSSSAYTATAVNSTNISYALNPAAAGTINVSTGMVTWSANFSGIATVTAVASGVNGPKSSTFTVTVNPIPPAPTANGTTICSGSSGTLTAIAPGGTYNWYEAASGGTTLFTGASFTTPNLSNTTTYYVDVTSAQGCTSSRTPVTITVNPVPPAPTANGTTICSGSNTTLTASAPGGTYDWFDISSGGTTIFTGASFTTPNLSNTTTYYVQTTVNGCNSARTTVIVTVNPIPTAPVVNSNSPVCSGTSLMLTTPAVTGASYTWTGQNGFTSNLQNPVISSAAPQHSGTYSAIVSLNGCNSPAASITVTVYAKPTLSNASFNQIICSDGSSVPVQLMSNMSGATFTWTATATQGITGYTASGTIDVIPAQFLNNHGITTGTVTYNITPFYNGCEGISGTYTITVKPKPAVTSAASGNICSGTAQSYTITSNINGATFSWSRAAVTGISNAAISNQNSNTITEALVNTTSTTIAVTYTIVPETNGCTGTVFTYTILVNPIPTITSAANESICNQTAQNYQITSNVSGATFSWSRAAVAGISNAAISNQNSSTISETLINISSVPVSVAYTIIPNANNCAGASFTYTILVNPASKITSAANGSVCDETAQDYTITSNVNNVTFNWSRAAVTGISNAAISGQTSITISESLKNTTSAPILVTYTITPEANGCTGIPFDYEVTVNPTATVTSAQTATICNETAQNYTITSNVSNATFNWSRAAVAGINNTAVNNKTSNTITETLINTTSSPITVNYTIVPEINGCSGTVFTYTILVNPTPALSNTSFSQVICSEASSVPVTLTSNVSGANFTWTATASSGITGFTASGTDRIPAQTLVNSGSTTGTISYQIKTFYNNCEGVTGSYTISVNPKPATPPASSNSPVCDGTSLKLTTPGVSGAVYVWTGPNGFTSNQQNPEIANANLTAQGTYSLTVIVNSCSSDAGTTNVTVNPIPPAPLANSNGNLCEGETLRLTASAIPGAIYQWNGPNGFTSAVQNPVIDRVMVAASGNYMVSVTVNGCISAAASTAVLVNPIPSAPTVNSNSPVCATANLNLFATGSTGASYSWIGPNGFTSTLQNPVITAATPVNSGKYTVTVSVGGCVSPASSINILVTPLPAEPVLTSNSPVCSGSSVELTSTTFANASYHWTGPNDFTSTLQNPKIDNATIANQGRYTVVITTAGCAVTNTAFIDIKVNQTPNAPVISNNGTLCIRQTLKLSATTITDAIYNWTGPNSFTSNLQNPEITNVTTENAGKYMLVVTVNGCTSAAATTTVIINKPSVVFAGNDQVACASGPAVVISGSISGSSTTGIWSTSGSGSFPAGNTNLNGTYLPSAADISSGNVTLTLTATNTAPCAIASSSFKITFIPTPVVFAGEDQAICLEDQVILNGKISNGITGVWSSSGTGTFSPNNNSLTATYRPSEKDKAKGSIMLTLTGTGNCAVVTDQVKISLIPSPKVSAGNDIYIMEGEKITLQPAATGTGLKYSWTPNLYLDNSTLKNPVLTGAEDITYTLTVTGTAGCEAQDQVFVKVLKPIIIPNTFTPNADGVNDTWGIKELSNYPDVTVKIFNRYGIQLFYSQGYSTPWDGTFNRQQLPVGTYYYIIDLKTYGKLRSGPVTIIR